MLNLSLDDEKEPEDMLSERPESGKHTIILVKNKWRASKSFSDKYIGDVHDRCTKNKLQFSTEVQSLAGRMIGHDKMKSKYKPIIYCQMKCIEEYINLFNNNFNYDETSDWKKTNNPSYMKKELSTELTSKKKKKKKNKKKKKTKQKKNKKKKKKIQKRNKKETKKKQKRKTFFF